MSTPGPIELVTTSADAAPADRDWSLLAFAAIAVITGLGSLAVCALFGGEGRDAVGQSHGDALRVLLTIATATELEIKGIPMIAGPLLLGTIALALGVLAYLRHAWTLPAAIAVAAPTASVIWLAHAGVEMAEHSGFVSRSRWVDAASTLAHVGTAVVVIVAAIATVAWFRWRGRRAPQSPLAALALPVVSAALLVYLRIDTNRSELPRRQREAIADRALLIDRIDALIVVAILTMVLLGVCFWHARRRRDQGTRRTSHCP